MTTKEWEPNWLHTRNYVLKLCQGNEDMAQHVLMKLWEWYNGGKYDPSRAKWFTVVANKTRWIIVDYLRAVGSDYSTVYIPRTERARRAKQGERLPRRLTIEQCYTRDRNTHRGEEAQEVESHYDEDWDPVEDTVAWWGGQAGHTSQDMEVLLLYYAKGLRQKDIAQRLQISNGRVSQILGKYIQRLKEAV